MTELTITPRHSDKTARFSGTVAAGEHVAVTIKDAAAWQADGLQLRVMDCMGGVLAVFPQPDAEDAWTTANDGADLACTLNLNTLQMLDAARRYRKVPVWFVLGISQAADGGAHTLYFCGRHEVVHWPKAVGDDEPYDMDAWPGQIDAWAQAVKSFGTTLSAHVGDAARHVTDAERAAWNAKQDNVADLAAIRAGAAAGATAYQKPASGVPLADLAPGVQTVIRKAETMSQDISGKAEAADVEALARTVSAKADRDMNPVVLGKGAASSASAKAADADRAVAVGMNAKATGTNSDGVTRAVAVGAAASAAGAGGVALGPEASATASLGTAAGYQAKATAAGGVALGYQANAAAERAVQLGSGTVAQPRTLQFMSTPLMQVPDAGGAGGKVFADAIPVDGETVRVKDGALAAEARYALVDATLAGGYAHLRDRAVNRFVPNVSYRDAWTWSDGQNRADPYWSEYDGAWYSDFGTAYPDEGETATELAFYMYDEAFGQFTFESCVYDEESGNYRFELRDPNGETFTVEHYDSYLYDFDYGGHHWYASDGEFSDGSSQGDMFTFGYSEETSVTAVKTEVAEADVTGFVLPEATEGRARDCLLLVELPEGDGPVPPFDFSGAGMWLADGGNFPSVGAGRTLLAFTEVAPDVFAAAAKTLKETHP